MFIMHVNFYHHLFMNRSGEHLLQIRPESNVPGKAHGLGFGDLWYEPEPAG